MTISNDFRLHVLKQNPNIRLTHDQGWTDCAVGEFLKDERGLKEGQMASLYFNIEEIVDDQILFDILNDYERAEQEFPTYLELQEYILTGVLKSDI